MSEREFFLGHPVNFRFPLFHRLISCYLLESMYLTMISLKCTSVQLSQLRMLWGLLVLAPCLVDTCGYILGCTKINFFSRIEPVFLYGMCISHTRSHAKFQTSSLNDLAWPTLFENGSWPSRKSFKMTWKLNVWPCHIEGHQKCSPKWNNTWCFRLLEVC